MFIENIRLVATKHATDNAGMMSRMRAELGMRQSSAPSASGYIIQSKIKKAMSAYSRDSSSMDRTISVDRMITRLNKYSLDELKYLHSVLMENGVMSLFETIRLSRKKLISKINAANREVKDRDDSDFNMNDL